MVFEDEWLVGFISNVEDSLIVAEMLPLASVTSHPKGESVTNVLKSVGQYFHPSYLCLHPLL